MSAPELSEQTILEEALSLESGEARVAYLKGACNGDRALTARLEWLIRAHQAAGGFLRDMAPSTGLISRVEEASAATKLGEVIGRYKLVQKIGEGGCGVVYLAEQEEPVRRPVALKLIKLGMDTRQVVARFEAERQALALMDHPNIAKVFDAGATDTGHPFFVMELVKGIPITLYCDQQKLSTSQRLGLVIKVCHAVQHAHQKGIIHRDIKPSNILVTLHEGTPEPKVIDFGIAKATQPQLTEKTRHTQSPQFIGTPAYMSPEQAQMSGSDVDIDTRSDIYSLGVLLYELLVGHTPFDTQEIMAAGLDEIRRTIREKEPVRPSLRLSKLGKEELTKTTQRRGVEAPKLISLLRGDLDLIVLRCLEKDRTRRYQTANGLARDLKRYLADEPVEAAAPSGWYLLGKFVRRHRTMLGVAAGFAALLVVATSVSGWQAIRATQASRAEKKQRLAAQAERDKAHTAQQLANRERAKVEHALYVAGMNLAQVAWEQNNIGRVREILRETESYSDRSFEWFYWQRQTHLESTTLRWGKVGEASVFSPDGERIVTASADSRTARVWDLASGKEVFNLPGHKAGISALAYSRDGRRIVTASDDHRTAFVWDAATGNKLLTLHMPYMTCRNIAISPDNQRIVAGFWDDTAKVWDALSGKQLLVLRGHTKHVTSVAFSQDSRRIVTGSEDTTARVWDAATGNELLALSHSATVNATAYSDDDRWIISGGDDAARVWDARNGQPVLTLNVKSQSVAFSRDSQRIVTGSGDRIVRVWDAKSGQELLSLKGHNDGITSVAFSPDGQRILTTGSDATTKIWHPATQAVIFNGHQQPIAGVAFSPDGQRVATVSNDETDPWNKTPSRGAAKVWEASSGKELFTLTGHTAGLNSIAFSSDGTRLVTASNDNTAKIWDAADGRLILTLNGHIDKVYSAAFSPDGRRIATTSKDATVKLWDAADGKPLLSFPGGRLTMWVSFSPDGQRILTPNIDGRAVLWDATTGRENLTLGTPQSRIFCASFSPDGKRIVTGGFDRMVRVWDAQTAQELVHLSGHGEPVWTATFSPDGERILTGGQDGTAKLWKADSGKELLTLRGHTAGIRSAAFSPDGQRIVTTSYDATARIWEVATPQQAAAFGTEEKIAAERVEVLVREEEAELLRAKDLLAEAQVQRAGDPGAIKQWWVLAPIPLDALTHEAALKALNSEQIFDESNLRPSPNRTITVGGAELAWKRVELQDYALDVNRNIGKHAEWCVGYAIAYVQSEQAQSGLLMKVGTADLAKVYFNGKEIYRNELRRNWVPDDEVMDNVTFRAGPNVLVLKLVDETNDWFGSIRFTDSSGQPLEGLHVSMQPP